MPRQNQPTPMTITTLLIRSLRFHWRAHLSVLLGATLASSILVGALAVGDSVRFSLRTMALARLGKLELALSGRERFFRAALADELSRELRAPVAPVIVLRGTAGGGPENVRVPRVQVVGADERFWHLAPRAIKPPLGLAINQRLAQKLKLKPGDELLVRVDKPSLLSRDAPLSTVEDASVALRLPVSAVIGDDDFGRFSLEANQIPPFTVFVPLDLLQHRLAQQGRSNTLLVGGEGKRRPTLPAATSALIRNWQLADAGLELRELLNPPAPLPDSGRGETPASKQFELRTDRVFLDPPVSEAALKAVPGARGVLTYFVNELRVGARRTPYSTVAALPDPMNALIRSQRGEELRDNEIIINSWLAEDLQAHAGQALKLSYFVVGEQRKLEERTNTFRVRSVVGMAGAAADADLMPPIPGLSDKKNCREWEPGVPVKLERLRDKDQDYWAKHRGTPKAFITLRAGQRLWNNRFGNLTAVRYSADGVSKESVELCLKQALNPALIGLFFSPVRAQALAAAGSGMDFGLLFIGFSMFLIAAALLLTALLFAFSVERRTDEVGVLLALGFTSRRVQRIMLLEGVAVAALASLVGALLGVFYTRAVIHGLATVWRTAVVQSAIQYHSEPKTFGGGSLTAFAVAMISIWLVVRKQAQSPARELLHAGGDSEAQRLASPATSSLPGARIALIAGAFGLALIVFALTVGQRHAAETFFGAGTLLLIAGLGTSRYLLARLEQGIANCELQIASFRLSTVGTRNTVRRRARSLAVVALLACGSFMVIAVGASRHDPSAHAAERSSGTGGFALFAESSLPVHHDLNHADGREHFGLEANDLRDVRVLPLRVREGDEASCLNLNKAQTPRLFGVDPEELARRGAFAAAATWKLLSQPQPDGAVPAIGDLNTVVWSLSKFTGQTLPYRDDRGREFRLRFVAILPNSVMQGGLLISERNFVERFPSQSGYQTFLIDAPAARQLEVARALVRALEDVGLEATPTAERLAMFGAVESTYLSIFAVLGGLGLLLGSAGLGIVVLRNVLDRRSELALMRAIGFQRHALHWLIFSEHALLLALGICTGVIAALVAVLPALRTPATEAPIGSLALTMLAVVASGAVCTAGATALSLRGPLLNALRNE